MRRSILVVPVVLGLLGAAISLLLPARVSQEAVRSSVIQDSDLVERAWRLPVASTFDRKVTWQSNGSRCGPASIANVYRSLSEAAQTEHDILAGTGRCWTGFCILGLTLDELAEVARFHTGRKVTVLQNLTPDEFKDHMRKANILGRRYIINFSRKLLFGAGVGHFSPIGGYLESEDLVFVLDVNRDYQPWLVE